MVGSRSLKDMRWSTATVVENREASADGTIRTLLLSVDDAVVYVDGRKVRHVQQNKRWLDTYKLPGQLVAVRYQQGGESLEDPDSADAVIASRLLGLASSPYEARSTSVSLNAAIVELLVYGPLRIEESSDAGAGHLRRLEEKSLEDDFALASLGPGCLLQVSEVLGSGFSSLFNTHVDLQSCLEEGRPLVIVAVGCTGIAPVHAALDWTPVLAHAGVQPVTLIYVSDTPASTAYLVEFDGWREAGVDVRPLYVGGRMSGLDENGVVPRVNTEVMDENDKQLQNEAHYRTLKLDIMLSVIENALFGHHGGLKSVLGGNDPSEAAVVLSGVPGEVAAPLSRKLTQNGVLSERLLVCDYGL